MNCNSENITSRYFIKIFIEFQNQKQILIPFVGYRTFLFKFYRKELLVFKNIFPCHLYWIIWNQSLARPCYWCINLSCQLQNFLIQKSNNGNLSFYVYILCISFYIYNQDIWPIHLSYDGLHFSCQFPFISEKFLRTWVLSMCVLL